MLGLLILPCMGGWRDSLRKMVALEKPPRVESTLKDGKIVVTVTNLMSEPLTYSGESPKYPQVMIEEFQDGKWTSERWSSCGGHAQQYSIAPGQSVDLRLNVWMKGNPTKIYSIFSSGSQQALVLLYEKK